MNEPTTNSCNASEARWWLYLTNPFHSISGGPALAVGLLLILTTGGLGSLSRTHLAGVVDFQPGSGTPLWFHLAEGIMDWLVLAILLYASGKVLTRSRGVRALDMFGGQALARAPYFIAVLGTLAPAYRRNVERLALGDTSALTRSRADIVFLVAVVILALVMLAWMVMFMYRAYAHACNLKGPKAIFSFVAMLVAGEILSKIAFDLILRGTGLFSD